MIFSTAPAVGRRWRCGLYIFLIPFGRLPNRNLTRCGCIVRHCNNRRFEMSDLVFLALGAGTLFVLALYARALGGL
ncbi:hypothetical protein LXM94_17970 [Rhizobium sp. TRM95111]|uniref:hypothetical protein n=1 Tax=Rhizobium alarense TaxID=2846851 RepID=UPI001F25A279|nr:hypothetical protein [Rhizobium alarense]MCF3641861.1 hypothetical protein [Rhizobium alarense]